MPKLLLVEDNELNRDMLSRWLTGRVKRIIPKPAYYREKLPREVARLLGTSFARGALPGEERPR